MRNKRMFSMDIIDTDKFLDMPISARLLYYDLGMRADDDGFVASPRRIMRTTGVHEDDLKILISKGYVHYFDSGIIVILDWKINNTIRNDRYVATKFYDEKQQLRLCKNNHYAITEDAATQLPAGSQEGTPDGEQPGIPLGNQEGIPNSSQTGTPDGSQVGIPKGSQNDAPVGYPIQHNTKQEKTITTEKVTPKTLLLSFGLSPDVVNELLQMKQVAALSASQVKLMYQYALKHASANPLGYFLALLKNKNFSQSFVPEKRHYNPNCPKCHGTGTYKQKVGNDNYTELVEMPCDCYQLI